MRDRYGIVFPSYFTGTTGREIQAAGLEALALGVYLGANAHCTMIGLYYLPIVYVAHDLPVLSRSQIVRAFDDLAALPSGPYAEYDFDTAHVWIRELARFQLNLAPGARLSPRDKRHRAIVQQYDNLRPNPFLEEFFDRYGIELALPRRRRSTSRAPRLYQPSFDLNGRGFEGASKGL